MSAPWVTYRPEIKVLDCTVRDGGLVNDHFFDDGLVKAVYQTCIESGIDYMEVGYKNSPKQFPKGEFGPWKHCDEEDINRVLSDHDAEKTGLKLAAMADAGGKSDWKVQLVHADESVLDMIRVATYIHQIPLALDMIKDAHDKGYETTVNLMALSTVQEQEIEEALSLLIASDVGAIYVVDSFGSFYSEQISKLVEKFLGSVQASGKQVGIHAHNNQQLAFANTIEATIGGANLLEMADGRILILNATHGNSRNGRIMAQFIRVNKDGSIQPALPGPMA